MIYKETKLKRGLIILDSVLYEFTINEYSEKRAFINVYTRGAEDCFLIEAPPDLDLFTPTVFNNHEYELIQQTEVAGF